MKRVLIHRDEPIQGHLTDKISYELYERLWDKLREPIYIQTDNQISDRVKEVLDTKLKR